MRQRSLLLLGAFVIAIALNQNVFAASVDLSLDESISLALQNNYDVKYANSSREKYYWAFKEAQNSKGVAVSYVHSDERYNTPPTYYSPTYTYTTDFDNAFTFSLPIYSGGKLEDKVEQAKLDLKVADLDIELAKQQIRETVITDYFTVLEYREEAKVDQETVNNYVDHLNLVKQKFDLGLVAKTEVLSSQVNLAKAQDSLIKAQNNYNNAVAALNNAIGLPHDTEVNLKDDFSRQLYPLVLEECMQKAVSQRPEMAQYAAKGTSAQYDVKIAKSGYLPTVDLTAEQDWYDTHLVGTKNNNWLIKLTTSLNVFDSGVTNAKVQQAKHNADMISAKASQERDAILLDVRQYYLSMNEAEKRIETNQVSVNQAEENLMIEKAKYQVGVTTNLDILDAVLALDSAKKDYIQAVYDFNTYRAKLDEAIGLAVK
ncbi:MAG: outer rane efflux protein [Firmicutes bacterium]|nr:outer rane efflux protein [Bacillota bacterium]